MGGRSSSGRLDGRVALVTGAGSRRGIGRGIALALAGEGARVVAMDLDGPLAAETASRIRQRGGQAVPIQGDVAVRAEVERAVGLAVRTFGSLDVLVSNAGIVRLAPFLDLDDDTFDRTFAVNVRGAYLGAQAAARQMVRQGRGGVVIFVSSTNEAVVTPALAHYSASKAAVGSLTRSLAAELGRHRIRVNAVGPGTIQTDILRGWPSGWITRRRAAALTLTPLGRLGWPEDVARAVVFLCSGEAEWISGVTLFVDGGLVAAGGRSSQAWMGPDRRPPGAPGDRPRPGSRHRPGTGGKEG